MSDGQEKCMKRKLNRCDSQDKRSIMLRVVFLLFPTQFNVSCIRGSDHPKHLLLHLIACQLLANASVRGTERVSMDFIFCRFVLSYNFIRTCTCFFIYFCRFPLTLGIQLWGIKTQNPNARTTPFQNLSTCTLLLASASNEFLIRSSSVW